MKIERSLWATAKTNDLRTTHYAISSLGTLYCIANIFKIDYSGFYSLHVGFNGLISATVQWVFILLSLDSHRHWTASNIHLVNISFSIAYFMTGSVCIELQCENENPERVRYCTKTETSHMQETLIMAVIYHRNACQTVFFTFSAIL